jgi:hypothetical protein
LKDILGQQLFELELVALVEVDFTRPFPVISIVTFITEMMTKDLKLFICHWLELFLLLAALTTFAQ